MLPWHAAQRAKAHQFPGKQSRFFCCFEPYRVSSKHDVEVSKAIQRHHPWFIVASQAVDTDPQGAGHSTGVLGGSADRGGDIWLTVDRVADQTAVERASGVVALQQLAVFRIKDQDLQRRYPISHSRATPLP